MILPHFYPITQKLLTSAQNIFYIKHAPPPQLSNGTWTRALAPTVSDKNALVLKAFYSLYFHACLQYDIRMTEVCLLTDSCLNHARRLQVCMNFHVWRCHDVTRPDKSFTWVKWDNYCKASFDQANEVQVSPTLYFRLSWSSYPTQVEPLYIYGTLCSSDQTRTEVGSARSPQIS